MTRLAHFLRLVDLDGLVCARTLSRECGCSIESAAEWLAEQARRDRIRRVVPGRYAELIGCARPVSDRRRAVLLRSHRAKYARRRAAGLCVECEQPAGGTWRCAACRARHGASARKQREEAA